MLTTVELDDTEWDLVDALNAEPAVRQMIDQETRRLAERIQHWLILRKNYSISGAMRWENSQEAWMVLDRRTDAFKIGELT